MRERVFNGPVIVAWVAFIDTGVADVPPHEKWIGVGGALTLFLSALHAQGYGAKTLSGRKCSHPAVAGAFCAPSERLVAFVCAGTPSRPVLARGDDDADAVLSNWRIG